MEYWITEENGISIAPQMKKYNLIWCIDFYVMFGEWKYKH